MWYHLQTIGLNLSFYLLLTIIMIFEVPLLILIGLVALPFCSQRKTLRNIRELIKIYGRSVLWAGWPWIRVYTQRPSNPLPKPSIYICNHRATSDGFLVSMFPCEGIQVVNIWPFKIPILGFFAKLAGYLSVRELPIEEFMQRANKLLNQGVSIIGFPEGTRSGNKKMGPFHSTLFRLALKTKTPIVPVCISGSEKIPKKGSIILHPGKIYLRFLPPIPFKTYEKMTPFKLKNHLHSYMKNELNQMDQKK